MATSSVVIVAALALALAARGGAPGGTDPNGPSEESGETATLCPDPERRAALRTELTAYNRDDLDALADVLRALQTLGTREAPGATVGQARAGGRRVA